MNQKPVILGRLISEELQTLGEPVMKTIEWHLKAHGVFLDADNSLDVRQTFGYLEQIVGGIAHMMMDEIYEILVQRYSHAALQINPDDHVLSRIEQLLAANSAGEAQ